MKNELLHTPDGVRDIFGNESAVKRKIEESINDVFDSFGYESVQTPTFEYFDVFSEKRGSVPSKDLLLRLLAQEDILRCLPVHLRH